MENIKVIAFDADDTLWINEPYFRASEKLFSNLLSDYATHDLINANLFKTEIDNLDLLGYGTKSFIISMIESAIRITDGNVPIDIIQQIVEIGKDQLQKPVVILDGVKDVLLKLKNKYRLVMATKGELKEQESKLIKSGLEPFFHHIEIMSEKNDESYNKLIKHLDIQANQFLMIGNSLKSDIIPVLKLGGHAMHIPFHTTWEHEHVDVNIENDQFKQLDNISDLLKYLPYE